MVSRVNGRPERRLAEGRANGLRVEVSERAGGIRVVSLAGEATVWETSPLRDALAKVVGDRPREAVIDLTHCTLLSSLAIAAIMGLQRKMRAHAGVVRLAGAQPMVREIMRTLRLEQLFAIHPTLAEALDAASFRAMSMHTCA